jgi:hypothetical protein
MVTDSLNYTGALQTYTVPCGVTQIYIEAYGAAGGNGSAGGGAGSNGGSGGLGGKTSGYMDVTPGQSLFIYVGGAGSTGAPGFNGGGTPGTQNAGGGGGATDIRINSTAVADRILVAGGGGGGGRGGCETAGVSGGNGGSGNGGNGSNGTNSPDGGAGFGATGANAGAAGIGCGGFLGQPGVTATNENGGNGGGGQSCCCFSIGSIPGGGGGGGGMLGGGGGGGGSAGTTGCTGNNKGGGGGGAGGTGYTDAVIITSAATAQNMRNGNGVVKITYSAPIPVMPVISGNTTTCQFSSESFSVPSDPNASFFTWSVDAGLTFNSGQNTTTINVTAQAPGTYTVSVYGYNQTCSLAGPAATYTLTVNPAPTITATASASSVCAGSSVDLTAGGGLTYLWNPGNSTTMMFTDTPSATTTYTVIGVDGNGCANYATTTVTVNPLPTVTATTQTPVICDGAMIAADANGASTYDWQPGSLTGSSVTLMPSASTTYTITGTDANGCVNSTTLDITVNPNPTLTVTANPTTVCAGSSSVMTASGASTYSWSSGGSNAVETVTPTTTTTYTVTGTDANGCTASDITTINVNPLPTVTLNVPAATVCLDDAAFALTGGSPAGGNWSGPGVSGSNFTPMTAGTGTATITYSYTDGNGCTATATDNVVVSPCTGVQTIDGADAFTFSPNPASDKMILNWGANVSVSKVEIVDLTGRVVITEMVNGGNSTELHVSTLPAGVYNLVVTGAEGNSAYRFVKQ